MSARQAMRAGRVARISARRNAFGMNGKPWLLLKEAMSPNLNGLPNVVLALPFQKSLRKGAGT